MSMRGVPLRQCGRDANCPHTGNAQIELETIGAIESSAAAQSDS
jgi:hypothetical protein